MSKLFSLNYACIRKPARGNSSNERSKWNGTMFWNGLKIRNESLSPWFLIPWSNLPRVTHRERLTISKPSIQYHATIGASLFRDRKHRKLFSSFESKYFYVLISIGFENMYELTNIESQSLHSSFIKQVSPPFPRDTYLTPHSLPSQNPIKSTLKISINKSKP